MKPMLFFAAILLVAGCNEAGPTGGPKGGTSSEKVQAAMAKLPPEDRALAEQQKLCPVTDEPLGSMGVPIKVMVKDVPVFVCCAGCDKKVLAKPDEMITKVGELKARFKTDQ